MDGLIGFKILDAGVATAPADLSSNERSGNNGCYLPNYDVDVLIG